MTSALSTNKLCLVPWSPKLLSFRTAPFICKGKAAGKVDKILYEGMPGLGNLWSKDHWSLGGSLEGSTTSDSLPWPYHCVLWGEDRGIRGSSVSATAVAQHSEPDSLSDWWFPGHAMFAVSTVEAFLIWKSLANCGKWAFRWKFTRNQVGFSFQAAVLQWGKTRD